MSDKPQTTPTPWKIEDRTDRGEGFDIYSPSAHYSRGNVAHYVSEADAALIVTAVNAHEALVDFAQSAVGHLSRLALFGDPSAQALKEKAEAALRLAEGEKE